MKATTRYAMIPTMSVLLLAGCATTSDSTSSNDPSAGQVAGAGDECDAEGNAQGITADTIKLGVFTPTSGGVGPAGRGAVAGQKAYFNKVNKDGGVQGRTIKLVVQDDKYDPAVAQEAARRLDTSENVFAFSGGVGTPNFVAVLPYIRDNEIPAIGPYAPSNQVGVMENPNVYMIWPNFVQEFQASVGWVLENENPKKIAMVQMTGDVGDDALAGVELALEGSGIELEKIVNVEATTTDYSSAVLALRDTEADWVISINQPTGTGQLIQAAKRVGYAPRWVTQSDMTDESWLDAFGSDAEGLIAATKVAPLDPEVPLIKDFIGTFEAEYDKEPSMWNAVGYAQAMVTVEALTEAPALTRDCLEYALQNMDGYETGLIPPVTFGPDQRQGTLAVGIAKIVGGKVTEAAPFQPIDQ